MKNKSSESQSGFGLEDIINQILRADYEAQEMVEASLKEKSKAEKTIQAKKQSLKDEYRLRAEKRLEETRAQEEKFAQAKIKEMSADIDKKIEAMNAVAAEKKESYISDIYSKVLEH